jgi:hypothetical protein
VIVLAIDPGSTESALVWYDAAARRVTRKMKLDNTLALAYLQDADHLAIEMAESFGAKVWSQVFTTVLWAGRFVQAWGREFTLVTRRQVKMHLAGSGSARDGQIRNCLIERWGGADRAIGKKRTPGPLHGVTADCWQALAIAVTFADGAARSAA